MEITQNYTQDIQLDFTTKKKGFYLTLDQIFIPHVHAFRSGVAASYYLLEKKLYPSSISEIP